VAEGSLHALICDDDTMTRRVVATILEQEGFEVVGETELAIQAIELVRSLQPHVVVLDLALTGLSGTDALPDLQAAAPDCQVVVFTAWAHDATTVAATAAAVVPKSEPEELAAVLREIATRARAA
jgi:DNA-binding NarL/FixJ family response regulator